ncbi:IS4 family transposase [Candidatus Uabimicrobium sp. HlEnr_7]|uniref:IS4 family transposase n=1 Tax=Candidatus Uabimicrobium helgolandensis TaxID=3095367 RepID=UPI0035588B52
MQKNKGLPFIKLLRKNLIEEVIKEEKIKYRSRVFTPAITLWAFLSQILSDNNSCEETAGRVRAFFTKQNKKMSSICASAYCQARQRLPKNLISKLVSKVVAETREELPKERLWRGRRVAIVDGSCINAPDTIKNQEMYPQIKSQKEGCGFPIIRIAVAFCLATGMVIKIRFANYSIHERVLFRRLYENLEQGTVVLGDRGCCSYCDSAYLQYLYKHDFVFRVRGKANTRLANTTYIVEKQEIKKWHRPKRLPDWVEMPYLIPESMEVRLVQYKVNTPGFRSKEFIIVTSLLDFDAYTFGDIAQLYFLRWNAELYLRTLKTNMCMEKLKGKTPDILYKEIYAYVLAYNLIRLVVFHTAVAHNHILYLVSFRHSQYSILSFLEQMRSSSIAAQNFLFKALILDISKKLLPVRTTMRVEPRRIKQRMKRFTLLTKHRNEYKVLIIQGISTEKP